MQVESLLEADGLLTRDYSSVLRDTLKTKYGTLGREVAGHHIAASASMTDHTLEKYPLLAAVLSAKGLPVKGVWTIADVAQLFDVRNRAIYDWVANQKLAARDLPGRGRFLSEDLEEFLRNSKRIPKGSRGEQ